MARSRSGKGKGGVGVFKVSSYHLAVFSFFWEITICYGANQGLEGIRIPVSRGNRDPDLS